MKMTDSDNVLIDSSVWIDFFRGSSKILTSEVERITLENRARLSTLVQAELIAGILTPKEANLFASKITGIPLCQEELGWFLEAAELRKLAIREGREGKKPGLADCFIAKVAEKNHLWLFTADLHFKIIKKLLTCPVILYDREKQSFEKLP